MPLPALIQTSDTFNTWFDATNNLISHVSNTSVYVLVNNTASGNVAVTGTVQTASIIANANVVLAGTTLSAGVLKVTTNSSQNTVTVSGQEFSVNMTNTVFSGTDLTVAPNTTFNGTTTLTGVTTLTKNTSIITTGLVVTSNATTNATTIGTANVVVVSVNSTVSTFSTNSTTYTVNAANIFFTSTNLTLSPNTVINGQLTVNNALTVNGNTSFGGNVTFTKNMVLGGSLSFGASFIGNAIADLSGLGTVAAPLTPSANDVIFRVGAIVADKVVSGIEQANTSQYRQLVVFNVGTNAIFFQHANNTVGANAVLCPGNTNFQIPAGGTCLVYYDANTSIQKWRVISAPIVPDANSTVSGLVNTSSQTFAGIKTFNANAVFNGWLTVNNTIDLNTLSTSRLVLPVGADKWST